MVSAGDRFGKLTTISPTRIQTSTRNAKAWECLCDCGKTTVVAEGNLTRKIPTSSCGCGRRSKSNISEDVAQERCRNAGYTLLKYSGTTHAYSTILCEVCGECCETRLDNLWTGYIPCQCSRSAKLRESDILERLYNLENVVSITTEEFNRGSTYCNVVFGCGHFVRRKFSKFTSVLCPVCNLKSSTPDHKIVERIKEGFTVCLDGKGINNLTMKCHEHGELYTETIFNHEKTSGCRKCISSYKSEVYSSPVGKLLEGIGRTKFIPDTSTYVNMTTKMKLLCPEGHVFYAEPVKVIHSGRGCPYCAKYGFKRAENGKFYVTRFTDDEGSYLKYGITNRGADDRAMSQRREGRKKYEILMEHEFDGETCLEIERLTRKTLGGNFCSKDRKPDGYTETLEDSAFNLTSIERIVENMSNKFKPLLAVACQDITTLNYPVIASVKCDGIRAIIKNGVVYSRTMKPIPSETVQQKFGKLEYEGLDGELVYGDLYAPDAFNKSTSFCMSKKVPEGFESENIAFYAFDVVEDGPYANRIFYVADKVSGESMKMLPQHWMKTPEELKLFQTKVVEAGGEGVMIRSPEGRYKQGRSTLKEGILLKLKIFTDEEAFVVGFEEKMHNNNEAKVDELGYTDRSTSKEGMVPANTLGALVVESEKWGRFNIGTGFDDKMRKEIWDNRSEWVGKLVKFKYFEVGVMEKPRFPVYLGIRDKIDV